MRRLRSNRQTVNRQTANRQTANRRQAQVQPATRWRSTSPSLGPPIRVQSLWAPAVSRTRVAPGEQVMLVVRCQTAEHWHIYAVDGPVDVGVPTRLNLTLPAGMTQPYPWQLPTAAVAASPLGEISTYAGDFRFVIPLQISPTAPLGKMELQCEVAYQACSESTCLAPGSQHLVIPLTVQSR
ncbi:MAG: protein-disulfide reductase DsbD family protein [Pirellulaceae bacterium]